MGAQFWAVFVPTEPGGPSAVEEMFQQIDFIHRLAAAYPRAVSYTHLRAHETALAIVCRLLHEKQKTQKKKQIILNQEQQSVFMCTVKRI